MNSPLSENMDKSPFGFRLIKSSDPPSYAHEPKISGHD